MHRSELTLFRDVLVVHRNRFNRFLLQLKAVFLLNTYIYLVHIMSTLDPPVNAKELGKFWTWMGPDGICRTKTKPQAEINFEEAFENSKAVNSFYTNRKYPLLVDARNIKSITKEARKQFAVNGRDTGINSFALMVKSPLSMVIGNFFMGLNKPSVPARLFDNEEEALKWLKKFI